MGILQPEYGARLLAPSGQVFYQGSIPDVAPKPKATVCEWSSVSILNPQPETLSQHPENPNANP